MSTSRPKVNLRSTAVKRIMQEASELADPREDDFVAAPLENDIFEWHCTMRGVAGSEFDGGLYHLRILLPPSYPMAAPDIMLLTPNGRFELGKKICIDGLTSFHAGSWQPAWGIRTAITGLRSFWMQGGEALSAIGAVDFPKEERKRLARISQDWVCPICAVKNSELLPVSAEAPGSKSATTTSEPAEPFTTTSEPVESEIIQPGPVSEPTAPSGLELSEDMPHPSEVIPAPTVTVDTPPEQTQPSPTIATQPRTAVAVAHPSASPQSRNSPLWIDICLFVLVSLLVGLIARRLAQS